MKSKIISENILLSIALVMALILGGCNNSGNTKTESVKQDTTPIDSIEKVDFEPEQDTSESVIDTTSPEEPATETNETAETETGKTETPVEEPKSDIVSTTKVVEEKEAIEFTTERETPVEEPKSEIVSTTTEVTTETETVLDPEIEEEKTEEVINTPIAEEDPIVSELPSNNWIVPEHEKNKANMIKADAESKEIGQTMYSKHCKSCHGKYGEGDGPKARELDTSCGDFTLPVFKNQTDGSLFYKIRVGREDMPAYKKKLPDEEDIWHIINYIKTFE